MGFSLKLKRSKMNYTVPSSDHDEQIDLISKINSVKGLKHFNGTVLGCNDIICAN
jgi:hypothetical protein